MDVNPDNEGELGEIRGNEMPNPAGRIEYRPQTSVRTNFALVVQSDRAEMTNGAVGAVIASEATLSKGYSTVAVARELSLEKGGAQWLLAGEAHVNQGGAGVIVARNIDVTDMKVGVLLAANVTGNVQAVFDRNSALSFGAAFGFVLGIVLTLRRIIR